MDVGTVRSNISKMAKMGASMAEVDTYVTSTGFSVDDIKNVTTEPERDFSDVPSGFISTAAQSPPLEEGEKRWQDIASSFYTPALEAGGAVAGITLGAPASPLGSAAAGAGGFAMGANAADRFDEFLGVTESVGLVENLKQTGEHFGLGLLMETGMSSIVAGGALAGKSVAFLANKYGVTEIFKALKTKLPAMSDKAILLEARDMLKKIRKESPGIQSTKEETEELLKRAGVKTEPTHAQLTGNVKSAALEKELASKDPQLKAFIEGKTALINREGSANIGKNFPEDISITEVSKGVKEQASFLEREAATAAKLSEINTTPMSYVDRVNTTGEIIKNKLKSEKAVSKEVVDEAYKLVPGELKLPPDVLNKEIKNINIDFKKRGGGKDSYPRDIIRQMRAAFSKGKRSESPFFDSSWNRYAKKQKPSDITVDNLMDWRSQISKDIGEATKGNQPNYKLARRLMKLKAAIDETFDGLTKLGPEYKDAAEIYIKAKDKRIASAKLYDEGSVGKVLQYGVENDGAKIIYSEIPSKFFTTGKVENAQSLINVVGKDKAKTLIDDFVSLDLLAKADNSGILNVKLGTKWLKKNKDVLDEFGLYKKYDEIIKTKGIADDTLAKFDDYAKGVASKILGTDPGKLIGRVFSGAGKSASAQTMRELLALPGIKENPVARKGVENGFKDFLLKSMKGSGVDMLGNPLPTIGKSSEVIEQFLPAMRVLYKDSPKKLQSLVDYNKILIMLGRGHKAGIESGLFTQTKNAMGEFLTSIGGDVAQLGAVKLGKGWMYSVSRNLLKSLVTGPGKFSKAQIDDAMKKAIYSPEYADILMSLTKPVTETAAATGRMRLRSLLLRTGGYMATEPLANEVTSMADQYTKGE